MPPKSDIDTRARAERQNNSADEHHSAERASALLATARVKVRVGAGRAFQARALLDSGSQVNLITEQCVQRMGISKRRCELEVSGIGAERNVRLTGVVQITIVSEVDPNFSMSCEMFIIKRISSCLPMTDVPQGQVVELSNMQLADPMYNKPARIELLLGAQVWADVIKRNIKRHKTGLTAQDTHLGWIIFGQLQLNEGGALRAMVATEESPDLLLDENLKRFWEIEELSRAPTMSADDQWVEENFRSTHYRDPSGRYVVTIPIRPRALGLGNSKAVAMKRFLQIEKKLCMNQELRDKYTSFMREYQELDHMRPVNNREPRADGMTYYIPHHCVTRKFRVVFDASCKTDNGVSLNDLQLPGAKLQDDLAAIITRFRCFKVAITADVQKMYRQVRIDPSQWDLQRIFWREHPDDELREFCLTVVTYGMTSSSFNAVRALNQCAEDHKEKYPLAYEAITKNFYVDDMLSGADEDDGAIALGKEVISSLRAGGFELAKCMSSSEKVRSELCSTASSMNELTITEGFNGSILGLVWNSATDEIQFKVRIDEGRRKLTKRAVVSEIARLYDPNGYLAPVIVRAKIFIQDLWRSGVQWDERIPAAMVPDWESFCEQLPHLAHISVPRWLGTERASKIELHGFADASTRAYAAVVYLRSTLSNGETSCILVASKTRVAPLKTISIPRLELCAAHLLCKLVEQVSSAWKFQNIPRTYWTDSMVALFWFTKIPFELKTFEANRVSAIQELTGSHPWKHVSSGDNPADLATRGIAAARLKNTTMWWAGPHWLKGPEQEWPNVQPSLTTKQRAGANAALKPVIVGRLTQSIATELTINDTSLLERRSTLRSVLRVTSLVFRFARKSSEQKSKGAITPTEQEEALTYWVKVTQQQAYSEELQQFKGRQPVNKLSSIATLTPFVDSNGVIRVGGRLQDAELPYSSIHQVVLPPKSKLSSHIIREAHQRTLHGGVQLCIQYIRQQFWMPTLRRAVKSQIEKCVICFRQKQTVAEQLMGSLPKDRVQRARAFKHSGVDYPGPVQIKARAGRSKIIEKGYIAVFVCMVTRAIHLELVSNQSSEAFLAAFHRFTGRRGACAVLWSDNATTFVGADRQLRRSADQRGNQLPLEQIRAMGTQWKFIVPGAPHTGGIWEAGVKSLKHHLRRVMGKQIFTFETLATTLVQIEACLNSRPLSALSDDPGDLTVLTPGHFLIGEQIVQPLTADVGEIPQSRLKLWTTIHQMQQHFWKKWSEEYVHTLQQRFKWRAERDNIAVGDLVLVKQENMPPTVWPLGRVTAVHPGRDGLIRSADIKMEHTTLARPVQKLCILPKDDSSTRN